MSRNKVAFQAMRAVSLAYIIDDLASAPPCRDHIAHDVVGCQARQCALGGDHLYYVPVAPWVENMPGDPKLLAAVCAAMICEALRQQVGRYATWVCVSVFLEGTLFILISMECLKNKKHVSGPPFWHVPT